LSLEPFKTNFFVTFAGLLPALLCKGLRLFYALLAGCLKLDFLLLDAVQVFLGQAFFF
jgi:hypothetical protein